MAMAMTWKISTVELAYGAWWFGFRLEPIFIAASKNDTRFKRGRKRLKNNHLSSFI